MAKKRVRQSHSGSVYQSGGVWYAAVMVHGKRRRVKCESKSDANQKRLELCDQVKASSGIAESTFGSFRTRWIDHIKANKAGCTHLTYKHALSHFSELDQRPLEKITGSMIQGVLDSMPPSRMKQQSFDMCRQMLRAAIKWKSLVLNPMASLDRPSHGKPVISPFETVEVTKILKECKTSRYYAAIRLAFAVGLRGGELWGLHWADLRGNELTVQRQACEVNGSLEIKTPKTASGIRKILLPDSVVNAIADHRKAMLKEGNAGSAWMFPQKNGKTTRRSLFGANVWKPLLDLCGIDHRGFHHARHTAATMLLNSGAVPLPVVSKMLGHASPRITLETYSHCMTADLERHRNAFDGIIAAG